MKKAEFLLLPILVLLILPGSTPRDAVAAPALQQAPIPVFAYYYIWFDPSSWDRAKIDLPQLGAYSSDDPQVMRQHITWAKQAHIDGFIVSWKSTPALNRRLTQLVKIADEEHFHLAMIYEGLDFQRNPLPVAQVANDFDYFLTHYAADPAFALFRKPLTIWSGTWMFAPAEVAGVTASRRDRLTILATEKNVKDYTRLADLVDGDAYYWSSVDPNTYPGYEAKLSAMGAAIHAHHGLWIAPAAPGFDARLVGGTQTVDRRDGATLRRQMDAALGSSPDAVGLISWNEFSENSYVEPSQQYGRRYLDILSDIRSATPPSAAAINADSSDSAGTGIEPTSLSVLVGLSLLLGASLVILVRRNWLRK